MLERICNVIAVKKFVKKKKNKNKKRGDYTINLVCGNLCIFIIRFADVCKLSLTRLYRIIRYTLEPFLILTRNPEKPEVGFGAY
jgi:hypothetical protein